MQRCLFVDDEPIILAAIRRLVRAEPFECVLATDPHDALEMCRAQPFDIVVSDFRMPRMTGVEMLRATRIISPDARRLLLTGQSCPLTTAAALADGTIREVIHKPFERETLLGALRAALSANADDAGVHAHATSSL
jgi:CheY-like chemotaxis protein